MSVNTNESCAGDMNSGDDFVKLDLGGEHIEFDAIGEMREELIEAFELAKAKLYKTPCPASVRVDNVSGLGAVDLHYFGHGLFGLTIGGMRVEIVQQKGRWIATIHAGGPQAPDEEHLAELEDKVRRTKEYLFGKEGRVALKTCAVALYCHVNPDASDTLSNTDTLFDFVDGRVTKAKGTHATLCVPGSSNKLRSYIFGSASGGRQVRLSTWGGPYSTTRDTEGYASPSDAGAYSRLIENNQYQEDRAVVCVKLIFHSLFIRHVTQGTDPGLSRLLRELVRATLGDETLPHSFFRVATIDSTYLPGYLRPNSAAWERVRRAFLEGVAMSE